jgi:hypothetical protein
MDRFDILIIHDGYFTNCPDIPVRLSNEICALPKERISNDTDPIMGSIRHRVLHIIEAQVMFMFYAKQIWNVRDVTSGSEREFVYL